jgi:hypothetical protein
MSTFDRGKYCWYPMRLTRLSLLLARFNRLSSGRIANAQGISGSEFRHPGLLYIECGESRNKRHHACLLLLIHFEGDDWYWLAKAHKCGIAH